MTAVTLTEAAAIAAAYEAQQAIEDGLQCGHWPEVIASPAFELADTLECYEGIKRGALHPAAEFPELEHDDQAYDRALRMAARDAADWAAELTGAIAAHLDAEGQAAA